MLGGISNRQHYLRAISAWKQMDSKSRAEFRKHIGISNTARWDKAPSFTSGNWYGR
jgi:hypothetical protein